MQALLEFPDDGPVTLDDLNYLWAELSGKIKSRIDDDPMTGAEKEKRRVWNLIRMGFGRIRDIVFCQEQLEKLNRRRLVHGFV